MIKKILLYSIPLLALGAIIGLAGLTLIDWWWPVMGALLAGLVLGRPIQKVIKIGGGMNYLIISVYTAIVLAGGFYTLNYAFERKDTAHIEEVIVNSKSTQQRKTSSRKGRPGHAYTVYLINVTFSDGRNKNLEVPLSRYNKIRTGNTTRLTLSTGLFGIPVISKI